MGLFSLHEKCFLCHHDTGFNKHNTVHGYICQTCLNSLSNYNINLLNIKKYDISELRELISKNITIDAPLPEKSLKERAHDKYVELQKIKNIGVLQIKESEKQFRINGFTETHGKLKKIKSEIWYQYKDLIDYVLLEDSDTIFTGGIGHALIGGALFGPMGAATGCMIGMKEKKVIDKLQIKVTINNLDTPIVIIPIISKRLKTNTKEYLKSYEEAQQIIAALDIISHNN